MIRGVHVSLIAVALTLLTGVAQAQEVTEGRGVLIGREQAPGVASQARSYRDQATTTKTASGPGSAPVPTSTVGGAPRAPRVPTILISTNACTQRAENGAPTGVTTTLRDAIGECIRDLPAYSPPGRERRGRPDLGALAWSAIDEVRRIAPAPALRIAPQETGLTGLPSYFWLARPLGPIRAVAEVPGIAVVAEAHPDHYLWRFGEDGDHLTPHSGRPWTMQRAGNIAHLYETKGRYDVSVEVVWAARWRIGSGPWRALGFFSTVDSARYPVQEVIPVLTDSG